MHGETLKLLIVIVLSIHTKFYRFLDHQCFIFQVSNLRFETRYREEGQECGDRGLLPFTFYL